MEAEPQAEEDFVANGMLTLTQDPFGVDNNDNLDVEGERCGICMDIVIDRGVLDCCQHWFCFVCIDNWATITNLCPLCQNEFQLITCVPVYDTIGSNKVEEDSIFRDDDWSIEGKNNTLSFPSYYIDENAVICLDGDGCKVRSGSATIEGGSGLDTSIACDSCDIWYHAFCVGFDAEGTSDSTWLCPRCVVDEDSKRRNTNSIDRTTLEYKPENANRDCQADDSLSGKVSVSVADAGETAVVVSMVEGSKWTPTTTEKSVSSLEVDENPKTASCISVSDTNNWQKGTEKMIISPIMEDGELELSLTTKSLVHNDLKESVNGARSETNSFDGTKLFDESLVKTSSSRNESDMGLVLGLSVGSFLSVDNVDESKMNDQATDVLRLSSEEFLLKGDEIETIAHKDNTKVTGGKRKHTDCSYDHIHAKMDDRDGRPELHVQVSQKKIRADGSRMIVPDDTVNAHLSDNARKYPALKHSPTKEIVTSDIMNIVKGTNRKLSKVGASACDKLSEKKENPAGLRVKKIMKRTSDDGESSLVVQNLRREIREAVRNKSSKNFEENHFDPKLLAAFRAAIAGPKIEPVNKISPLAVKAKKSMLQKGKVREHLTKKIFGTSNGRRKRAWDRDCEIEFWKYRCMRATKPEKIETLKSVLNLLRNNSESPESNQGAECQFKNSILSRLYLADTSVFPRKDDVKPLSVLETPANSEQTKQNKPPGKGSNLSLDNNNIKAAEVNNLLSKASSSSAEKKVDKKIAQVPAGDNSVSSKVHLSCHSEGMSGTSAGAKVDTKELGLKSDSKTDKRKWALEVLARKTAAASRNASNKNQEANANFKGNYPLLAQLPTDMRPVLAPSRHNKIPISVRQTQLYRLTEHFLRNANLPVIHRTADTELAVADAINIEKEVADRSNSKLVYVNLCSQELLHHTNNAKPNVARDTNPPPSSAVLTDQSEQNTDDHSTDPAVEIALKNAGLLSDSPPSSPHEKREMHNADDLSGPDNILELDSHPELDIYGDFEYDLEDEDYIGASVMKVSNHHQEESDSKVKLVFSTMNLKKSDIALDCAKCEGSEINEVPPDVSSSPNCHNNAVCRDSTIDVKIDQPSGPSGPLQCEGAVEPSDAEFEELYGPDKEPTPQKFPDGDLKTSDEKGKTAILSEANNCHNENRHVSDLAAITSALGNENLMENVLVNTIDNKSSDTSDTCESTQWRKETSDTTSQQSDSVNHVTKKVEAYIKEHIRPLCKSGVITSEQYRWAVAKTTDKVMKYHCKAKNANFLIKEGEKVKKLAEQYVEAAQQSRKN